MIKQIFYAILLIALFFTFNIFAQPKTLSPEQLKKDFSVLRKILMTIHPEIYRFQTPEALNEIFDETEAKLNKTLTEGEFFVIVSQTANKIYCGHTFVNPYNQKQEIKERLFGGKTYLPFYFRIVDGKFIVTENASRQNLSKGSEITKINGIPAKKVIETLLSITKGDGRNVVGHRINSLELPRFDAESYAIFDWYFPLFFPLEDEKFKIEAVDFKTKKRLKFSVDAMTKQQRTEEISKRYGKSPTYDDGWKFEIRPNNVGYLKIANSITWKLEKIKHKEFLAEIFAELRRKNVQNLIIDLRENGGGDTTVGFELAKYLADKELPQYSKSRRLVRNVAAQKGLAKYMETYDDQIKFILQNGLPENFYRKAENGYFEILPTAELNEFPKIKPYENNFKGKTFVVTDTGNASATFQFLKYVQDNNLATIIGQTTGGNKRGINGGIYLFLYLPNSKIEVDIPVLQIRLSDSAQDESIIPDVSVKKQTKDIGNDFDREIEKIYELIGRK